MNEWRSYHVHYSDVDRLIVDCAHPFLERWEGRLARRSWERHYAGGPQLRIRLCGPTSEVAAAGRELSAWVEEFLSRNPSPDLAGYSEERAARLLEWEETPALAGADLRYRNNVLEEHAYPPAADVYTSREAAALMEDFRHDVLPLATRMLMDTRPRREALLRLYFLQALEVAGELAGGSVSYKSHWEGFASCFKSLDVIERVKATYQTNRDHIQTLLDEVAGLHAGGHIAEDRDLAEWQRLLTLYGRRANRILKTRAHITRQAADPADAARMRRQAESHFLRKSEFVSAFWANDVFLASLQHEPAFLVPRILINLLYTLVVGTGLKPIDKFALCHFAYRAAEERSHCDLTDILKRTIDLVTVRNAARWGSVGAPQSSLTGDPPCG
jgi:hypothetical protein